MAQRTMLRAAAVLGACTLVLAGCGGGGGGAGQQGQEGGPQRQAQAPRTECNPPQARLSGSPSTAPLKIGSLLPETGSLAFLGPPEFAGVDVAVDEVNAAGGVLGAPVTHIRGDSGDDTTDTANQTVDRELGQGVQAILGAAASGVSKLVIDKITSAEVVQLSPANTSDEFTCWQDKGLYFRTAPPDVLQAQALAELMASDGAQRVAILARNDPYGAGLAENTRQNLIDAGIPDNQVQNIIYDPNAAGYNAEIDRVREFNPDAIAVIGFDESQRILTRMSEIGIGPRQKLVYGSDGNMGNALGEGLPPGLLQGMKGTTPLTDLSPQFEQRLLAKNPQLVDFNYAGESYDAVVIVALAAEVAGTDDPVAVAAEIPDVTREGTACTSFEECQGLLADGEDIDYNGVSGPIELSDAGDPTSASVGIYTYGPDNKLLPEVQYQSGELEG